MLKRLLLGLTVAGLALLVTEGGLSLAARRSLLELTGRPARVPQGVPTEAPALPPPEPRTDAERMAAAASGAYTVHEDPRVRYVLRPGAEHQFVDAPARVDERGQRVRPGPPPAADALRLVVLGDSVAFGYGVADDQTLAVALERTLAGTRGPEARPLACFTVGAPSWNHRAALHYLFDHWDALEPDVVVYVPVSNDLSDAFDVYEDGSQRLAPDPSAADPWLYVNRSQATSAEANLAQAWSDPPLGPRALESDLSPESHRRYDENAASIVALHDGVTARGARLLVIHSHLEDYAVHLFSRVQALRPELPILLVERVVMPEMTLVKNNHPNADTLAWRAVVVARRLLDLEHIDRGAGLPLPELPAAYAALLTADGVLGRAAIQSSKRRAEAAAELRPAIDLRTGEGYRQVYGGLNLDGTVRLHALALLPARGQTLSVALQPLANRPDLYPLRVAIDIDGQHAGDLVIEAAGPVTARFPLPIALAGSNRPFEVRLRPATWGVVLDRGRSQVASCRLLRLEASNDGGG